MNEYTHPDGSVFIAKDQKDGILIDPELPENFDNTPNTERSPAHMRWRGIPYIVTMTTEEWDAHYAALDNEYAAKGARRMEDGRTPPLAGCMARGNAL
jgi:hypothetical protein